MKRKWKKLAVMGVVMVMAAGAISGCGKRATPENLLGDMAKNAEKVESVLYNMSMKAAAGDETATMGISFDIDVENTKDPAAAHGKGRMSMAINGISIGAEMELYHTEENDSPVVYMMMENEWEKFSGAENGSMIDKVMLENTKKFAEYFTVSKEPVDVNGEQCFELKGNIGGGEFTDIFSGAMGEELLGTLGSENGGDIDKAAVSDIEIPCTIDIYKDSILPARIHMDLKPALTGLMGGENAQLADQEFYVEITYMEYDSVGEIIVPDNVIDAAGEEKDGNGGNIFGGRAKKDNDAGETASAKPAAQSGEPGSSWESFTVQVNDRVLTLPCSFSDLEKAGVSLDTGYTPEDYIVNAGEYELAWFRDANGNEIMADLVNMGTEAKSIKECLVGGISVDEFSVESGGLTVIFPGGVQIGTRLDDVLAAYGEADDIYEGDIVDMYSWFGEGSGYTGCEIDIDSETGLVSSMYIDHYE